MKKLLFIFLFFTYTTFSYAQKIYWNCYNIVVHNEVALVKALDDFMNTESGKSMTPASLSEMANIGSKYNATHGLCFFSPDASALESNREKLNNLEAGVLMSAWDSEVNIESSILGQSLIADPSSFDLTFNVVVQINVKDPEFYGAAFAKMKEETANLYNGSLELHEALAGQETGVTHFVVARAKSMADWVTGRNNIFASDAFRNFSSSVRNISEVLDIHSARVVKQYNVD